MFPITLPLSIFYIACCCIVVPALSAQITPSEETSVFPDSGSQVELLLDAPSGVSLGDSVAYRVVNYDNKTIDQGSALVNDKGMVLVKLTSPIGFYEIAFDKKEANAGCWSIPAARQNPGKDPFFGTDAAMTFLVRPENQAKRIPPLTHMIAEGGLARERFHWRAINPAQGEWRWDADNTEPIRYLYKASGIQILDVFGDAPFWLGGDAACRGAFPLDLAETYNSWRIISQRWHEIWGGLEIWNEPDLRYFSGDQPADRYVAMLKAIRLALHDEGVKTPIGGGAFSQWKKEYIEHAIMNGLLENCDFISFHYYGDPLGLENMVSLWREILTEHGHAGMPLWITEAGLAAAGPANARPSVSEQARVALTVTMQAIESKACGIARHFPFLLVDYTERGRRFGFIDHNGMPLRAFAALGELSRRLDRHDYIGDIPFEKLPGSKRVRVFAPAAGEDAVVVLYTGNAANDIRLTVPFRVESATGIDGRDLPKRDEDGKITIPNGIAYLNVKKSVLRGLLKTDTNTAKLSQCSNARQLASAAPDQVIMQAQIKPSQVQMTSGRGYYIEGKASELSVNVWLNNISDKERRVNVSSPSVLVPRLETITIPPHGRSEVQFKVEMASLTKSTSLSDRKWLIINGKEESGMALSPVVLAVVVADDRGIADRLRSYSYRFDLALAEAYRWDSNSNGTVSFNHDAVPWGYDLIFSKKGDKWAYPRYQLPQEIDFKRVTGVLLRARCQNPGMIRLMTWDSRNIRTHTDHVFIPADGEWHVAYVPLSSFMECAPNGTVLHKLDRFSVGMGSQTTTNRLEISELYFVGE